MLDVPLQLSVTANRASAFFLSTKETNNLTQLQPKSWTLKQLGRLEAQGRPWAVTKF